MIRNLPFVMILLILSKRKMFELFYASARSTTSAILWIYFFISAYFAQIFRACVYFSLHKSRLPWRGHRSLNVLIRVCRYLFRSGNAEHPSDRFYNTTVEVLSDLSPLLDRNSNDVTEDGYVIIGKKWNSAFVLYNVIDLKTRIKMYDVNEIRYE